MLYMKFYLIIMDLLPVKHAVILIINQGQIHELQLMGATLFEAGDLRAIPSGFRAKP
jgi:hypothetical protein